MQRKRILIPLFLICACGSNVATAAECDSSPPPKGSLYAGAATSLPSPDRRWQFSSIVPTSSDQGVPLYLQDVHGSRKWNVDTIERSGTVFWSGDSKRVVLRDEYAADDTKILAFDTAGPVPSEIKGLDDKLRRAIFARIPENETNQWLYYPQICFAANDSSTIVLVADVPVVRKTGNSEGKSFRLKLTVNLVSLQIAVLGPKAPRFP